MQLLVKTVSGRTLSLEVQPTETVESVKKMLQERENVDVDHQRLVFAGKELMIQMLLVFMALALKLQLKCCSRWLEESLSLLLLLWLRNITVRR